MTELEKKIYECALEVMPKLKKRVTSIKIEGSYISFPFICDGVIDYIIYDTELKEFTKIEYTKGKDKGIIFESGISKYSAHFDNVERCSFEIPNTTTTK